MSPTAPFLYFAYGSNLKLSEIRRTCPSAKRVRRASLPEHRLTFPRGSVGRGCGVAGVEPDPGREVWGGLYRISLEDRSELDEREGYREGRPALDNAYVATQVTVFEEGDPSRPVEALTYFANRQPDPPRPSVEYLQLILDGGREWGLDPAYLAEVAKTETLP
jgi:gamma-glutamylcyclotransferase (GGCT)/AIG2-like uncharacterized protein YtfP